MPDRRDHPIELLLAFHDGDLPDAAREAFAAHVSACPTCQARLAGFRQTAVTLRTAPVPVDEDGLLRSIQARIAGDARAPAASHSGAILPNGHPGDFPLVATPRPEAHAARPTRGRRLRETGQFVAAGLAIVLVASLLVALFRDGDGGNTGDERAGTGSPTATIPAAAASDAPVRLIAWATDIYGDGAFKVVVGDTAGVTPGKLMGGPFFEDMSKERSPVWAPDGSMMVIVSDRDGDNELYAVSGNRPGSMPDPNATGLEVTGPRNITNHPGDDSSPDWSPDSRWIAFSSERDDNTDIYLTQAGSAEAARLTTDPGNDTQPVWSPDGSRIAFLSDRDGGLDNVYVMNADGSEQRRVSAGAGISGRPAWSPEGARLAFLTMSIDPAGDAILGWSINTFDLSTGQVRTTSDDGPGISVERSLALEAIDGIDWSPDGTAIVFARPSGDQFDLAVANPDGSGLTTLTNTPDRDELSPVWSPESQELLYASLPHDTTDGASTTAELRLIDRTGANSRQVASLTVQAALASRPAWGPLASEAGEPVPDPPPPASASVPTTTTTLEAPTSTPVAPTPDTRMCIHSTPPLVAGLFVMNADGSGQRLLVLPGPEWHIRDLSLSPDGGKLLGVTGGSPGIAVMNADGSDPRWITPNDGTFINTAIWSPDGSRIAYVHGDHANPGWTIYTIHPDGSDPRPLASSDEQIGAIAWSPDGSRIAFAAQHDERWDVFTVAIDGADRRQITSGETGGWQPSWVADGTALRYAAEIDRTAGNQALVYFEVDLESGETRQLDIFEEGDFDPVWSPDDSRIAFQRDGDIWSMAADGSGRRNLTQHPVGGSDPAWSSDGETILFTSHRVHWPPARDLTGQPNPIVLRAGASEQGGGGGRWCERHGSGMTASDVVGVVVPAEPLTVTGDATIELFFAGLGTATAVAVDIYDLTVAEQLGLVQDGALVPPCRPDDGCRIESLTLSPARSVFLTLDLPPGRYVLAVRANYDSTAGNGYTEQGFSIVVRDE